MKIETIPALQDNYIYIISDNNNRAVVVDPGEAAAAQRALAARGLTLAAVLVTHRHADHIGGLAALRADAPAAAVYAPPGCNIDGAQLCRAGDSITLLDGALDLRVIETPGHTLEHIVYVGDGFILSGDTLFIGGCGRVFEGTMQQMHDSLAAIAALPDDTKIYCGHEYTAANLRFAAAVEPDNSALAARIQQVEALRAAGKPTVAATLAEERQTNPYLRLHEAAVIRAAAAHSGKALSDSVAVFEALRSWKDNFRG